MNRIEQTLSRYRMLERCSRVIVGYSGGADSTALLHYLHTHFDGTVLAAHVNHQLRGEESDREEDFVRRFCKERDISLVVYRADVASMAKKQGVSVETCGRQVRYDFFRSLLERDTDRIATAHTLSDNGETVLFYLARGTGSRGLCGIPPVRDQIIRPLIETSRAEVEDYCQAEKLPFVEDSSNHSLDYTRNRIRHQIVPELEGLNPAFLEAIRRLTCQMMDQEEAMTAFSRQVFQRAAQDGGYAVSLLRQSPKAVVLHGLAELLRQRGYGGFLTDQKLEAAYEAVCRGQGGVTLCGTLSVRVEQGLLLFIPSQQDKMTEEIPFTAPGQVRVGEKVVCAAVHFLSNCKISENNSKFLFPNGLDYDTIPTSAVWRTRRPGDTFRPLGRGVTKSLKKLLQESSVPPSRRDQIPMLASGSTILWAEGFGVSALCAVTGCTRRVAVITVKEADFDAPGYRADPSG
ncbi:MAG: tRNA lysidine(34) synthetase TilS [Oscillospiraceae bacterium]|nr:tRNA lysidine(34) synthetase TilS [Oscillospiraceae bacterium]